MLYRRTSGLAMEVQIRFLIAVFLGWTLVTSAKAGCLKYSDRVTLNGRIDWKTFPGQPNYESVARGDWPERVAILVLDRPFCVDADLSSDGLNGAVSEVREVQIVTTGTKLPEKSEKHFAFTGFLFMAHTGHHHTTVLIEDLR